MNDTEPSGSDTLYTQELSTVEDFAFNESVTQVFTDMVRRSVPGYDLVVELIGVVSSVHRAEVGRPLSCIDLGCSRGAVTRSLLAHMTDPDTRVLAVDNSHAMIEAAKSEIKDPRVKFRESDILDTAFQNVDVAVMNLILQFIEPSRRLSALTAVRAGLRNDGMLVLTEKVEADASLADYHLAFKRARGYSELEIKQKRDALEKVMVIDSLESHQQRLRDAGFSRVTVWFQLFNWVSLIARI